MQKGNISVQTENIFPIIKQYLYSDQEIFLRELISNAVDATSKIKTVASKGEFKGDLGDLTIEIVVDKEEGKITIKDRGIGMTEDEVQKYLNQVAFSSAQEFLEKYKDDTGIIGHFGLGFYSAFMVADQVDVHTRSYKTKSKPVVWSCKGSPEYTIDKGSRKDRGTDIILHVSEDSKEFLEESKISSLLDKYCKFLPVEIKFGTKTEQEAVEGEEEPKEIEVDNIINNPDPAWRKKPNELTDENYKNFYRELYPFGPEPLFWIHLNIDYPFNLTGILYFPKLSNSFEVQKNKIKLYSNQVYVTDDVKDIVPEFLTLLHGVIDSPDIPLNVSRSYLQSDHSVKKITNYINKKVAEKLASLFKKDRENFEQKWSDIGVFVKYGMISEEKFHEKANKFVLLKNTKDEFFTLEEYQNKIKDNQTDKNDRVIHIYSNDVKQHNSFVKSASDYGYDILEMDNVIDNHFMQHLEHKGEKVTFVRVDSDTADNLVQKDEKKESVLSESDLEKVKNIFETQVDAAIADLQCKALSPSDHPVVITRPEFMRRMKEMQTMQGAGNEMFPDRHNIVVNSNHPLIAERLLRMRGQEKKESFAKYLYDLAKLNQNMLKGEEMTKFIERSLEFVA